MREKRETESACCLHIYFFSTDLAMLEHSFLRSSVGCARAEVDVLECGPIPYTSLTLVDGMLEHKVLRSSVSPPVVQNV